MPDCFYAQAVRQGAKQAVQVADRFHLIQNLRMAIEQQMSLECCVPFQGIEVVHMVRKSQLSQTDLSHFQQFAALPG